jgi:hypothetical protein
MALIGGAAVEGGRGSSWQSRSKLRSPGMTLETYHQALERMGASRGGPHPDSGCLFHCAWDTGGGVRVFDAWESQEQFEQFMQSRLADMGEELGIPGRDEHHPDRHVHDRRSLAAATATRGTYHAGRSNFLRHPPVNTAV